MQPIARLFCRLGGATLPCNDCSCNSSSGDADAVVLRCELNKMFWVAAQVKCHWHAGERAPWYCGRHLLHHCAAFRSLPRNPDAGTLSLSTHCTTQPSIHCFVGHTHCICTLYGWKKLEQHSVATAQAAVFNPACNDTVRPSCMAFSYSVLMMKLLLTLAKLAASAYHYEACQLAPLSR